jgi:hypothetical protein
MKRPLNQNKRKIDACTGCHAEAEDIAKLVTVHYFDE